MHCMTMTDTSYRPELVAMPDVIDNTVDAHNAFAVSSCVITL